MNNSIRVHLKDINNTGELPPDLTIQCSAVPHLGEVINLSGILPEENLNESGWWYNIERVEWTMVDGNIFEPVITLRKDSLRPTAARRDDWP